MSDLLNFGLGIGSAATPVAFQEYYGSFPITLGYVGSALLGLAAYRNERFREPLASAAIGLLSGTAYIHYYRPYKSPIG